MSIIETDQGVATDWLIDVVAEQLRSPLINISYLAEIGNTRAVATVAQTALQLLERLSYLGRLRSQTALNLETLNTAVIVDEVAHQLAELSNFYNLELQVDTKPRPMVVAERTALRYAVMSMATAAINFNQGGRVVRLSAGRQNQTVRLAAHGDALKLSAADIRRVKTIHSLRPLSQHASAAAELVIADQLFEQLGASLKFNRLAGWQGLAVGLAASRQLSLMTE